MIACATWLPSVALARAGVLAAARAAGLDLATAYARLTVLSSRRIALIRLGMAATIALCAFASQARILDAGRALDFALALGLAFIAPSLAIALLLPLEGVLAGGRGRTGGGRGDAGGEALERPPTRRRAPNSGTTRFSPRRPRWLRACSSP